MGEAKVRKAKGLPPQGEFTGTSGPRLALTMHRVQVNVPMTLYFTRDGQIYDKRRGTLVRVTDPRVLEAVYKVVAKDNEDMRKLTGVRKPI